MKKWGIVALGLMALGLVLGSWQGVVIILVIAALVAIPFLGNMAMMRLVRRIIGGEDR